MNRVVIFRIIVIINLKQSNITSKYLYGLSSLEKTTPNFLEKFRVS